MKVESQTPANLESVSLTKWLSVAAIIWLLDRVTKLYVVSHLELGERIVVWPFFSWIHLNNTGAAFSFLRDAGGWQRWFFVVLAVSFSGYLIYELKRLPPMEKLLAWSYTLILAGAVGNLYDRVVEGHVVDFILVHYQNHYFPAFNVADSAISVGAAGWILTMILHARAGGLEKANER